MLLPSEMTSISIMLHKNYSDELIVALHKNGLMQIIEVPREYISEGNVSQETAILTSLESRITRLVEILKNIQPKQKGLKATLAKKPFKKKIINQTSEENLSEISSFLDEFEPKILQIEKKILALNEEKEQILQQQEKLDILTLFDIDIKWIGKSNYTTTKFGITSDIQQLDKLELDYEAHRIGDKKDSRWAVVIIAHKNDEDKFQKIKQFEEIKLDGKGNPKNIIKHIQQRCEEIDNDIIKLNQKLIKYSESKKQDFLAYRELIQIEKQEQELYRVFGETNYTYLLQGWCLTESVNKLRNLVDKVTCGDNVVIANSVDRNPDEAPIHLKNPKWAQPFETFLELFALPKYNEANPTLLLGVSFILFFSVMLGDFGYGLMILIFSLVGRIKFRASPIIQNWSLVGIMLGISTMTAGLLYNSFFGDFIPRFIYGDTTKLLYSAEFYGINLPIDAIHKPVTALTIALVLGLAHLNLGFIMGIYQNIKQNHYKGIIMDQFPWFLLQIGGGMFIGDAMLKLWLLTNTQTIIASILTIVGLVILLKKQGPIMFFDITGYMGDWLSYARLLALGLATSGMALAFNVVAELMPEIVPVVGIALLPLVLVLAHFANLLLQALGAGVHALRLQYVEFFNRFYKGGGIKYIPFQIHRKFTEEKNE